MTHEQFSALMQGWLNGTLSDAEVRSMEEHLQACHDCALQFSILKDCQQLDRDDEVPAAFSSSWRQSIREEESQVQQTTQTPKRKPWPVAWRRGAAVAASLVFILGGSMLINSRYGGAKDAFVTPQTAAYEAAAPAPQAVAGAAADANMSLRMDADMSVQAAPYAPAPSALASAPAKVIRTLTLRLSTAEFERDMEKLDTLLKENGGYVEYSDIAADPGTRRYASLTLRVPKQNLDAYVSGAQTIARTLTISESQEDVSEQYTDVDTRLKTQQAKMDRLQALLEKATTVADILSIEGQIADTQYQVDSLTGSLRGIDSKVDYSTVSLSLTEERVAPETAQYTLWERIQMAAADAWAATLGMLENAAVFLAVVLPYLLAAAVLVVITIKLIRRKRK